MKKLIIIQILLLFSLAGFNQQKPEIEFSHQRGFYFKDFYLKLSFRNRDAKILFTTDGSEPTL
ncbi:MAG: chitobiase/beta-hexosaminidase C-terminal domain-containing protein, partial [Prolixibacteraceae bacterium]|nr:chitobiase/beta-hexosaminidase C-terminal domain-containing protein [Prolixibacteraceae bacterium]